MGKNLPGTNTFQGQDTL